MLFSNSSGGWTFINTSASLISSEIAHLGLQPSCCVLQPFICTQTCLLLLCMCKYSPFIRTPVRLDSVQFSSVAQSCPTLCDPMNRSIPGLPVHHKLSEFTQTHVHQVSDAIQPSHPLLSPSPPAPNPSQSGSFPMSQLFPSGGQCIGVSAPISVLPMKVQD